jgi:hypothetical protein
LSTLHSANDTIIPKLFKVQTISPTTLSGTSAKRVVLYRFDRQPAEGFVTATRFGLADALEMVTLEGSLQVLTYGEVKALCFVSESGPANLFSGNTAFERRPKAPGLWARFALRDGDFLEGVLSHNMVEWPEAGFLVTPPRAGSLRQRVFLPRLALVGTEFRGVIGKPAGAHVAPAKARAEQALADDQLSMFD